MDIDRRGFLRLIGAGAAVAYAGSYGLCSLGPPALPVREIIAYSILDDAMVWRVDVNVMDGDKQVARLSWDEPIRDDYAHDPAKFDAVYRQPALAELRKRIERDHAGQTLAAPPMPPDYDGSVERYLERVA